MSCETLSEALADEYGHETITRRFERFVSSYYAGIPAGLSDTVDYLETAEDAGIDLSELAHCMDADDLTGAEDCARDIGGSL